MKEHHSNTSQQSITRSAEWGHWGITFVQWAGPVRPYVPQILGIQYFGVGTRGPVDGFIGSPERRRYQDMVTAWMQNGVLLATLDTSRAYAGRAEF